MNELDLNDVTKYISENIGDFHNKRLQKLNSLKRRDVLKRKNPYMFKAKYMHVAGDLVKSITDAYLSSQEETIFGDFLESVAIFVCGTVYGGYKPGTEDLEGIDLVFQKSDKLYIVEIKSGPNWGNSSQIKKMLQNFQAAQEKLSEIYPDKEIVSVNGCSYGKINKPHQPSGYWKLCGQDFWSFISGNDQLYTEIIEPLGHEAKRRKEDFDEAYGQVINRFTIRFAQEFCTPDGAIDWNKIVRFTSERTNRSPFQNEPMI